MNANFLWHGRYARGAALAPPKCSPYVIIELLEPVDTPTTERGIAAYLLKICESVRTLHLSGFVHRDLKPKNIMCRKSGDIVLIDFGLAKDTCEPPNPRPDISIVSGKVVAGARLPQPYK